jgi:predicted acylesterase/phospholipase RssA
VSGEDGRRRRSLILAGGGAKVAFQAGVLQVWLDEAELGFDFDHADGASGGVFNLAMWCQGMSGTAIADNWRAYRPLSAIDPNVSQWLKLPFEKSLFRLGRFRRNVLRAWGLDWSRIRSTSREATFNLYNFTHHRHDVVTPQEMDEDRLISAVSLPMWFPPVVIHGDTYIDAVFVTDANIEEAIRRGADEVWIIWTVSRRGEWHDGFVAHYFQMIEAMANGQLNGMLARIASNNEAIAKGEHAEFGRLIEVKMLCGDVPLHYLLNFTRDRMASAVELGVLAGRRWCEEEGIPLRTRPPDPPCGGQRRSVRFTEEMAGHVGFGESDYAAGAARGRADCTALTLHLTIAVEDMDRFVVMPDHAAAARGWIDSDAFGGRLPVERGTFNLFIDQSHPSDKRMLYRLWFQDRGGRPLTLSGYKVVRDDPGFDLWRDTTTLYTRVLADHVDDADDAQTIAAGVLRVSPWAFARQLTTFRATAPTAAGRAAALARFGRLFTGSLWDVYGREVLSSSPF